MINQNLKILHTAVGFEVGKELPVPDCAASDIKSHPVVDTIGISNIIMFAYQVGKGSTSEYILG